MLLPENWNVVLPNHAFKFLHSPQLETQSHISLADKNLPLVDGTDGTFISSTDDNVTIVMC